MNTTHFVNRLSEFVSDLLCGIKPYLVKSLVNPCKPLQIRVDFLGCQAPPSHYSCPLGAPLFVTKRESKESRSLLFPNVVFTAKHASSSSPSHRYTHVLNFPPRRCGRSASGNYLPLNIPSHVYLEITYSHLKVNEILSVVAKSQVIITKCL